MKTKVYHSDGRSKVLDGMRGLAIAMVMAFHVGLLPGGGYGVTIFFVLSGYLITGLLTKPGGRTRAGLARFYARRMLRLFPALAVLCLFCVGFAVIVLHGHTKHFLLTEVVTSIAYLQDFYLGHGSSTADFGYLGHTWSLAIEEQFYLLWPLALTAIVAVSRSVRGRVSIVLVAAIGLTAWRVYLSSRALHAQVGLSIEAQANILLIGCALGLAMPTLKPLLARNESRLTVLAIGALTLLAVLVLVPTPLDGLDTALVGIATAVLLCRLVTPASAPAARRLQWLFSHRVLTTLGLWSYSLYLWHEVLVNIAKRNLGVVSPEAKLAAAPLLAVAIFGVSWLSYRYVETPFQRLKERRVPQDRHSSVGTPADGERKHRVSEYELAPALASADS